MKIGTLAILIKEEREFDSNFTKGDFSLDVEILGSIITESAIIQSTGPRYTTCTHTHGSC